MLDCLKFFLTQTTNFMRMLFSIDLGGGLNLGLLMCIVFIFLPMMLRIINFLKMYANDVVADEMEDGKKWKGGKR